MKTYGGAEVNLHAFFIIALYGAEWSSSLFSRFTPSKKPPVPIGQEAGRPKVSLDIMAKRKFRACAGIQTQVVQSVANHWPSYPSSLKLYSLVCMSHSFTKNANPDCDCSAINIYDATFTLVADLAVIRSVRK
jgi:hypothetical protein